MRTILFFLSILLYCIGCGSNPKISYNNIEESSITKFITSEINRYITPLKLENCNEIELKLDSSLINGVFVVNFNNSKLTLSGGEPIAISHALYTFLEKVGYSFDATGATIPETFNTSIIRTLNDTITPHVRYRGIRQHINFPMDISSYTVEQAKEYIDNLVRMRFNKLAFHAYPALWYEEVVNSDSIIPAGNFYYGHTHYIKDNDLLRRICDGNDSIFCIPDIEQDYISRESRSKFAIKWLNEIINYAQSVGLYTQISFEPRMSTVDRAVSLAKTVAKTYPQINSIEIITEEIGGWGMSYDRSKTEEAVVQYFGQKALEAPEVKNAIQDRQVDLYTLINQVGVNSQALKELKKDDEFCTQIKNISLGIYSSITPYTTAAYYLARTYLSDDTEIAIMPSHGSHGVAEAFDNIVKNKDDLDKLTVYSWIEFDGLMYTQQNPINGISSLILKEDKLKGDEGQLNAILYNHWRTAENRTAFAYASKIGIDGHISPNEFYKSYALKLGIKDTDTFIRAMNTLNDVDSFSTYALGNIGFCWVGAWRNGGSYAWMNIENMNKAIDMYRNAGEDLKTLAEKRYSKAADNYLGLLGNRVLCSIVYIDAFREASKLQLITENNEEKRKHDLLSVFDKALLMYDQYMELYAQNLPDRGSIGTVASVWSAPIAGLKILRANMTGVEANIAPQTDRPIDSPPLPIFYK